MPRKKRTQAEAAEARAARQTLLRAAAREAANLRERAAVRAASSARRTASSRRSAAGGSSARRSARSSGWGSDEEDFDMASLFSSPRTPSGRAPPRRQASLPQLDLDPAVSRQLRAQRALEEREERQRKAKEQRAAIAARAELAVARAAKPWATHAAAQHAVNVAHQLPHHASQVEPQQQPQQQPGSPETPVAGVPSFPASSPAASRARVHSPPPPEDPEACEVCRVVNCRCPPPNYNIRPEGAFVTSMQASFECGGPGGAPDDCACSACCAGRSTCRTATARSTARTRTARSTARKEGARLLAAASARGEEPVALPASPPASAKPGSASKAPAPRRAQSARNRAAADARAGLASRPFDSRSTMSASYKSLPLTQDTVRKPIRPPERRYVRTTDDRDWRTSKVMATAPESTPAAARAEGARSAARTLSLARRMFTSSIDLSMRPRRDGRKARGGAAAAAPAPAHAAPAAAPAHLEGMWQPLSQPRILSSSRR